MLQLFFGFFLPKPSYSSYAASLFQNLTAHYEQLHNSFFTLQRLLVNIALISYIYSVSRMVAMSEDDTQYLNEIKRKLFKIQKVGQVRMADARCSRRRLNEHLSETYLWWRKARLISGYLKNEYAKLHVGTLSPIGYGIDFRYLLILAYGHEQQRSAIDRDSRVVNTLHIEYEKNPTSYDNDGPVRLADFIERSGGKAKLSATLNKKGKNFELKGNEAEDSNDLKISIQNEIEDKHLRKDALLYLKNELGIHGEHNYVQYSSYVNSNVSDFSVLLVKSTPNGFEIIDVENEVNIVESVITSVLQKSFDVSVRSVRPLFELIQTQCLPKSLESLVPKLIDIPKLEKKYTSHRRVFYRPATNEFILSPMTAQSGVVSVAKPFFELILENCEKDVFMPHKEREFIETKLLRNYEFNLYNAEQKDVPVSEYPELNSASHVLHLRHRSKHHDFFNISFWPFYSSVKEPQDQLVINPDYVFSPVWFAHIDVNEIKRVDDVFLKNWIGGHAKYLTRAPHTILRVTFSEQGWKIEFVYEDNEFTCTENVQVKSVAVSSNEVTALFRTKDLIPALKCLADLPINNVADKYDNSDFEDAFIPEELASYKGGIWLELNDDLLCIKFSTFVLGGSEHRIYIPTADSEGNPSTKPFMRYFPEVTFDESSEEELESELDEDEL
jgi:hypothetical protein